MSNPRLDRAAIALSGLCMVHCVASVTGLFAIGLLSSLGMVDEWFHRGLLVLVVPLSVWAMIAGYRRHRRWPVLIPGLLAVSVLTLVAFLEPWLHGTGLEPILTTVAGLGLISTHLANIRACSQCV